MVNGEGRGHPAFTPDAEEFHKLVSDYRSLAERMESVLSHDVGSRSLPNRRQLLKASAAALAGLSATSLLSATPASAITGSGTVFLYPGPMRMVDTRIGLGGQGAQPANTDYVYVLGNPVGGVYGYLGTVTATNSTGPGYLVVHGRAGERGSGSTLNYGYFNGPIGSAFGCLAYWDSYANQNYIYVYNGGASTHIIIDLVGYVYS